ncbi:hypothetical protein [Psychrobacter sp. I-STPA10]|uniref:hypothetical protein n=1 Tax=Psychrobacter sp. I-STPA10 TaxID=2585769 RepID=UPI001E627A32|nr:hypothetical protein [Psychrobacter sp. I-STPA10]
MFTRPVTAIFVHPQERCYVVYCNGERHKLSRMKLDKATWKRKQPYTGSDNDIFLLKRQQITDDELAQFLITYDWPECLKGRTLAFFLSWWDNRAYDWLLNNQPINKNLAHTATDNNTTTQITDRSSKIAHQIHQQLMSEQEQVKQTNTQHQQSALAATSLQPTNNEANIADDLQHPTESKPVSKVMDTSTDDDADNLFDDMLNELSKEL